MSFAKVIFLDIGGTLVQMGDPALAYRGILERLGHPAEDQQVRHWLRGARQDAPPLERPQDCTISSQQQDARRDQLVRAFLSRAGLGQEVEHCRKEIWESWLNRPVFDLYTDTVDVLDQLRRIGFRLVAVSNWETRLEELCQNLGIARFFDFFVVSEIEGYAKPGKELFRRALKRAGVGAHEVVHVGNDLREDIQPALALGMRAVLIQREMEDAIGHSPRLPSLEGLPALLTASAWLQGKVTRGKGEAGGFTQLPWVRQQLATHFGFEPFPGTLNLRLDGEQLELWRGLRHQPGLRLAPPEAGFCGARCYGVMLEGQVVAAALVPEVGDYPDHQLEVVAPLSLRERLRLGDGDAVTVAFSAAGE